MLLGRLHMPDEQHQGRDFFKQLRGQDYMAKGQCRGRQLHSGMHKDMLPCTAPLLSDCYFALPHQARDRMVKSTVVDSKTGTSIDSEVRTSTGTFYSRGQDDVSCCSFPWYFEQQLAVLSCVQTQKCAEGNCPICRSADTWPVLQTIVQSSQKCRHVARPDCGVLRSSAGDQAHREAPVAHQLPAN